MSDFDIESLNLDNTPIEGIEEAFDNWEEPSEFPPPPQPGKKSAVVAAIREMRETANADGKKVLHVTIDLKMRGGDDEDKAINFVRLSGTMFDRASGRSSQLLDFVKSSGVQQVPATNLQFAQYIKQMVDKATLVYFQVDWQGYCSNCANNCMMAETGEMTDAAAREALEEIRRNDLQRFRDIKKKVGKEGTKFKNYRQFPELPGGNGRKDSVDCPVCGQEVRARANITRWLQAPSA